MSTPPRATRWLSEDLATLLQKQALQPKIYDLVIVGSGYGGAMAAAELAGSTVKDESAPEKQRRIDLCVLERGREYLPGSFPSRFADLARNVRFRSHDGEKTQGELEGLFDVRMGNGVNALIANGLGGGSLINAAVMEKPEFNGFASKLPHQVTHDLAERYLDLAKRRLGALRNDRDNTVAQSNFAPLDKTAVLRALAPTPNQFRLAALTIAMQAGNSAAGIPLNACTACGDCMTGCNVGARESLDTNLLVQARQKGAEIVTGASVLRLEREESGLWQLEVVPTHAALRHRQQTPLFLKARRVILAAGTLGSTEILLRSQTSKLQFSARLGQQFSCNGDNLAAVHKCKEAVNTVVDEITPYNEREVGPTITGIVDVRDANLNRQFMIQEFAVPAPLKRLFDELVTTSNALHALPQADYSNHQSAQPAHDPNAVDADAMQRTLLVGLIAHDSANGVLRLPPSASNANQHASEGALQIDWPNAGLGQLLERNQEELERVVAGANILQKKVGRVLPNPLWRMLPTDLEFLTQQKRGSVLTVHPLGGCPMGTTAANGVVDEWGRVFNGALGAANSEAHFDSTLMVLDGAVLPASLGANPALTIAALSLRAAEKLRAQWGWIEPNPVPVTTLHPRPIFRTPDESFSTQRCNTELLIVERLVGPVALPGQTGNGAAWWLELTLRFLPQTLGGLTTSMGRRIEVEKTSQLRLYKATDWESVRLQRDESTRDEAAVLVANLSGHLVLLDREPSRWPSRVWRAAGAWLANRGVRDIYQAIQDKSAKEKISLGSRARSAFKLATRAGEVRLFEYELDVTEISKNPGTEPSENPLGIHAGDLLPDGGGHKVKGYKRVTYSRRANPWRQLMQMRLTRLGQHTKFSGDAVLDLDGRFLAKEGVPLVQIAAQQDMPSALADLASLGLYMTRLLLNIHIWSFRKPDAQPVRTPQRLPGVVPGLPPPEIIEIDLDKLPDGSPVRVRLTRYTRAHSQLAPLVFIHGYGASGTTYAHHAVNPSLGSYFWHHGRDIWILDLRTSVGMPTAQHAWAFEDAAWADIPVAVAHILAVTGHAKVDIFAHCIGAVMLSMAILTDPAKLANTVNEAAVPGTTPATRYVRELEALPGSINKIVLSQKGPTLVYSEANIFRAYVMQHLRGFLPEEGYSFRPAEDPGVTDQLFDRLLTTIPYPENEFDIENPPWYKFWRRTPWVATRHRMDALYARDFEVKHLAPKTLEYIDDLFGAINLETVAQAIHLIRNGRIAGRAGEDLFSGNLGRWSSIKTLCIFGEENGIVDKATLLAMQDKLAADITLTFKPIAGYGHQDCLIGTDAEDTVFKHVHTFLE